MCLLVYHLPPKDGFPDQIKLQGTVSAELSPAAVCLEVYHPTKTAPSLAQMLSYINPYGFSFYFKRWKYCRRCLTFSFKIGSMLGYKTGVIFLKSPFYTSQTPRFYLCIYLLNESSLYMLNQCSCAGQSHFTVCCTGSGQVYCDACAVKLYVCTCSSLCVSVLSFQSRKVLLLSVKKNLHI